MDNHDPVAIHPKSIGRLRKQREIYEYDPNAKLTYYAAPAGNGSVSNWSSTLGAVSNGESYFGSGAYNGYAYQLGGTDFTHNTSTVYYAQLSATGSIGSWSKTTSLPAPINLQSTAIYNGYIYTLGGGAGVTSSLQTVTSTVWYANLNATGSISNWSSTAPLPSIDFACCSYGEAAAYNGYIYMIPGYDAGGFGTTTVWYGKQNGDGSIGNWSSTSAFPAPSGGGNGAAVVANNGYLYYVGGLDETQTYVTSTVYYVPINGNGSLGAWQTTAALPSAIKDHLVSANNGYIYSSGGNDSGGTPTSTVFYTNINGDGSLGGSLPAAPTGTIDSTIYDTGVSGGAQLNSVLWQGTQNGGTVQFQFATSNNSAGPFSFIGSDGTSNTYYTPTGPNVSKSLSYSLFNNFRYFKVRTFLKSNTAQTQSPIVNDVVVNWSP